MGHAFCIFFSPVQVYWLAGCFWFGPGAWPSDSSCVEIRAPKTDSEFEAYYELRWRILRAPWGEARGTEVDALEDTATHVAAFDEAKRLVGVGRLQRAGSALGQVRYMAVEPDCRSRGVGQAVLIELERLAKRQGMTAIVLDAREPAVGFYLKNGYEVTGDSYLLFGEIPHSKMEKQLNGSA
ncbi:MAG: GNAT family N-acetyltransferase [Verrucomicrobiota bacterium]|nr:GNAT family N-acetyltransferase [Verrucomicrobiota bacterium]